jgi:hypothetical protein
VAALLVSASILAACGDSPTEVGALRDEEALQLAFYRALFEIEPFDGAAAYCLSVGEWSEHRAPSAAVMAALKDHTPKVVGAAECAMEVRGTFYGPQKETARGYHVQEVVVAGESARIEGSYRDNGIGAAGYVCAAERSGTEWRIRSCEMTWIA